MAIRGAETGGEVGMTEREQVIAELLYLKHDCLEGSATDQTLNKAIDLLKAQQPRVMTLDEVNALDWDYCYLEEKRLPGKEYRLVCGEHILTCVTWPSITAAKITYGFDGYGKTWRCWTSRPTEAQRAAEAWQVPTIPEA